MKALKSSRIYSSEGVISGYIVVDGNKIIKIAEDIEDIEDIEVIDYKDNRIIPGIIDTHNHGMYGFKLRKTTEDDTREVLEKNVIGYIKALPTVGVTGVFPTAQYEVFDIIANNVKNNPNIGAKVLGIHSEGPYLNRVGENGKPKPYPPVDLNHVQNMIDRAGGLLKLFALAPEIEGIDDVIKLLKINGIKVALAHSDLKYEETLKAIEKGVSVATHLGNVMTGIHHRDIGAAGALLTSNKVECEIICDGYHLALPYIDLLFKVKDYSRFIIISDSIHLAGLPAGVYRGYTEKSRLTIGDDGFIRDEDGRINGSSKPVIQGIKNLVEKLNIPLEVVVKMTSENPAKYYQLGDKGVLKNGYDADIVVIDDDYNIVATYVEGNIAYDKNRDSMIYNKDVLKVE